MNMHEANAERSTFNVQRPTSMQNHACLVRLMLLLVIGNT